MLVMAEGFRDNAPTTAAQAATIILDGVRAGEWRILVGDDAHLLDEAVRADPEAAYEPEFMERLRGPGRVHGDANVAGVAVVAPAIDRARRRQPARRTGEPPVRRRRAPASAPTATR